MLHCVVEKDFLMTERVSQDIRLKQRDGMESMTSQAVLFLQVSKRPL